MSSKTSNSLSTDLTTFMVDEILLESNIKKLLEFIREIST